MYYKVDAPLRTRLQAAWNQPHRWPLALIALAMLALAWVARRGFNARERMTALDGAVRPTAASEAASVNA